MTIGVSKIKLAWFPLSLKRETPGVLAWQIKEKKKMKLYTGDNICWLFLGVTGAC
jgi:hypothetical protein